MSVKTHALKRAAVALGYGTSTDEYKGTTVVGVLKEIAVKMECAASVKCIPYNSVVGVLNYISENYGPEEHEPYDLNITNTNVTVTVKRRNKAISAGSDILYNGDKLVITATPATGFDLDELTVNDETFTSGETYTVNGESVYIAATGNAKLFDLERTETNCTVTVQNGEMFVADGEGVIAYGNELVITATPTGDYETVTITVNGEPFTSGETYHVTSDVTIVAEAE